MFTPARYDGLPGLPFPAPAWSFPTKDEMADYLEAYATRFDLPVRTGVRVDRLSREGDRYVVAAGKYRLEADHVVVAAGAYQRPLTPAFASDLDPGVVQLHSSHYRSPSQLREGGVLVVGAANSGAEIALEVSRTHPTWLSGRHPGQAPFRPEGWTGRLLLPVVWFMASHVLTVKTPIGRAVRQRLHVQGGRVARGQPLARVRLKDIAAAGIQRMPKTAGAQGGLPVLDDGRILEVANVIWCTGFVPDFGWIDLPVFAADGGPVHDRGIVASRAGPVLPGAGLLLFAGLVVGRRGRQGRRPHRQAHRVTPTRQPAHRARGGRPSSQATNSCGFIVGGAWPLGGRVLSAL